MTKIFSIVGFLVSLCLSLHAQHAGRYTDGRDYAVYFEQTKYGLTIRPVMWTATQLLREVGPDKFEVVDRTSRGAEFRRDANGNVVGVSIRGMDGEGLELRRESGPLMPVELFLAGRSREAATAYMARGDKAKALEVARQVLRRLPTKTRVVVSFLNHVKPHFENDSKFRTLLGYALVQSGDRRNALMSFRRAYALDPKDPDTISALARLKALPNATEGGWKLPFSLAAVFAKPTAAEILAVKRYWSAGDLKSRGVNDEMRSSVMIADHRFDVRIVSHLVHGSRHYGVILTPPNSGSRKLPVIIEAKGVSPTYFPLDLQTLSAPRMMGDDSYEFIYVVPTYRGEVLNFEGRTFRSEGDRTDALDGATDDAIALLNVALETTPNIDSNRICAFGRSRGGTVAMLAGIRDKRIKCVVNWSGPTDWFYLMGTNGWTEQELWSEGLRTRADPQQTGGQNVERFLKRAINGTATLKQVRHRMIASSPLYFAHRLPLSQHHYGLEDTSVPVRNGRVLIEHLRLRRIPRGSYQAFFYPGQGHDTDRIMAPIHSREFVMKVLAVK